MLSYEMIRVEKSALKPNPKELKVRKCNVCKFSRSIAMDGRHHDLLVHSIIVNSTAGNKHYARLCSIVLHSIQRKCEWRTLYTLHSKSHSNLNRQQCCYNSNSCVILVGILLPFRLPKCYRVHTVGYVNNEYIW